MSNQRIIPIPGKEIRDFSQVPHSRFWTVKDAPQPASQAINLAQAALQFLQESQPEVVCILTEALQDPALINWCSKASENNARIYLLTATQPTDASSLAGTCLMRFGLPVKGTLILVNPGLKTAKALLSTAPITASTPDDSRPLPLWKSRGPSGDELAGEGGHHIPALELDTEQTKEAFHFFTFHFWNTAKQEILQRQGKPQDVTEAPFTPVLPHDHTQAIHRLFAAGEIRQALLPSSTWDLSATKNATLLTEFNIQHPEAIGQANRLHAQDHVSSTHYIGAGDEAFWLWGTMFFVINIERFRHFNRGNGIGLFFY